MLFLSTPSARRATYVNYNAASNYNGFLSTPSARRATHVHGLSIKELAISIHALREEGDSMAKAEADPFAISIHALREEGDHSNPLRKRYLDEFLSTPSARRATA